MSGLLSSIIGHNGFDTIHRGAQMQFDEDGWKFVGTIENSRNREKHGSAPWVNSCRGVEAF